jgi:hypothetical protein
MRSLEDWGSFTLLPAADRLPSYFAAMRRYFAALGASPVN